MSGFTHKEILKTIPEHLRQFVEDQDYESQYTPQDHAVWRYIMHQQVARLGKLAHPVYLEGLKKTGVSTEHVPSIEEMNRCLSQLGWRAVVVDGFIPPAAFVGFHSLCILPVALDMRTIEHILYTPAPDIVHEAGGHAPFIADVDYGEYLQKFGEYGLKALYTQDDLNLYEAIRYLSIVKEDPATPADEVKRAEEDLGEKIQASTSPSETALLARLFWWTAEYGLVGTADNYKIFGAGLLSSIGESCSCLDDQKVKKIPLTVNCIRTKYDITEAQPQLFVTRSCRHMTQVLEEFASNMCFKRGGAASVQKAIDAGIVATCVYSSGVQVSGQFNQLLTDAVGNEIYLGTKGPTQLAYGDQQLSGHGGDYHKHGFGSPVGGLQDVMSEPEKLSVDELAAFGVRAGQKSRLNFLSGITVEGLLKNILRKEHHNILMTFEECTVTDANGNILFKPEWGTYDMTVGNRIVSVYSGSADRAHFQTHPPKSKAKIRKKIFTEEQKRLFDFYADVRRMRESKNPDADRLRKIHQSLQEKCPHEWLIRLEILELTRAQKDLSSLADAVALELGGLKSYLPEYRQLITDGMGLLGGF